MALSDWDTLAFDSDGKGTVGFFEGETRYSIEIYKNWVYLSKGEEHIGQLNEGSITLGDMGIKAARGPQSAVFVFAHCCHKEGDQYVNRYFAGIGCCGFEDEIALVLARHGRKREPGDFWCNSSQHENAKCIRRFIENLRTQEQIDIPPDIDPFGYCGVKQETVDEFFKWLGDPEADSEYTAWLAKCKATRPQRYNQGDAYFAAAGIEMGVFTDVGQADSPALIQAFKEKEG